jgi:hypothetical protein
MYVCMYICMYVCLYVHVFAALSVCTCGWAWAGLGWSRADFDYICIDGLAQLPVDCVS